MTILWVGTAATVLACLDLGKKFRRLARREKALRCFADYWAGWTGETGTGGGAVKAGAAEPGGKSLKP